MIDKDIRSDQHLQDVQEIYNQIVDDPGPEHDTQRLLDELCGGNTTIRGEVERLLAIGEKTLGKFMETSAPSFLDQANIAGYKIIKPIGEGGMGTVYLAEQENPRRQVALKTLRSSFASSEVRKRFEYEAQVLGQLKHPGIAQIYEAGSVAIRKPTGLEDSQPYFVMELVEGLTLTEYATKTQLGISDKLRLVVEVCQAVQSAHQQGIVHRDLKPANILVTESGQIKILDFGVARLVDQEQALSPGSTQAGQLVGTLAYMSPEQMSGDSSLVDTRSDVYSIGVILYELLGPRMPYDMSGLSIPDKIQKIRDESPQRISNLDSRLRGDIETIVHKSLEKDKNRRYQTATELAADINRHLNHLPIEARPASTIYQLRKFIRRNTGMVAAACVVLLTLITAGVLVTNFAVNQSIALQDAERQNRITREVNDFINKDLLAKANPNIAKQKDLTVRELLDAASEKIGTRFEGMPQVEAAIRFTIGNSYFGLGSFEQAELHLTKSRSLYADELGPDDERTVDVSDKLAVVYQLQWKLDQSEELCKENLAYAEVNLGEAHPLTALVNSTYAVLLRRRGSFDESESHYRRAIDLWDQFDHPDKRQRNKIQNNFGLLLGHQKRYDEAETVLRDVIKLWKKATPEAAFSLNNLGDVLWKQSNRADVEDEAWKQAKFDEAAELFQEALDIRLDALGELHPDTTNSIYAMALIYKGRGDYERAEVEHRRALQLRRQIFDADNIDILNSLNGIGTVQNLMKKHELAAENFRSALDKALGLVGPDHYYTKMYLGNLLYTYQHYLADDEAIQSLLEEHGDKLTPAGRERVLKALVKTLEANSKLDEAAQFQHRLDELLQTEHN